jgi:glycosyltransferase involved in cell wall biosynthesis
MAVPVTRPTPVAVVMTSFDAGGTERQMIELARRLDRGQWQVHIAVLNARGPWHATAAKAAPIAEFPITSFRHPHTCRQAWAFARWCARHGIEVVHTSDLYSNIFALTAAAFARVPVRIGSRRGLNTDRTPGQLALQRAAFRCAHAIVANSQAMARQLEAERVGADKIAVVPNGLDVHRFREAPSRSPRRRVITVANLRSEKGYDVLIDAAVNVLQRCPDARFECVGTGAESAALQARVDERHIGHAFTFLGQRDDVPALLEAADLFVLPSRTESLPNSVLEAMATGLPVVASAVGGIPELVEDGRTGLLFSSGDSTALAERLLLLMEDSTLAARLGEAARRQAHARYAFERMVSAIESLYTRELARRGRVRARKAA